MRQLARTKRAYPRGNQRARGAHIREATGTHEAHISEGQPARTERAYPRGNQHAPAVQIRDNEGTIEPYGTSPCPPSGAPTAGHAQPTMPHELGESLWGMGGEGT